jgi:hypothetical protein
MQKKKKSGLGLCQLTFERVLREIHKVRERRHGCGCQGLGEEVR